MIICTGLIRPNSIQFNSQLEAPTCVTLNTAFVMNRVEGLEVGVDVGLTEDGTDVGLTEDGIVVGRLVGCELGCELGCFEGWLEGFFIG